MRPILDPESLPSLGRDDGWASTATDEALLAPSWPAHLAAFCHADSRALAWGGGDILRASARPSQALLLPIPALAAISISALSETAAPPDADPESTLLRASVPASLRLLAAS